MNPTTLSPPPHTPTSSNKETKIPLQEEGTDEETEDEPDNGSEDGFEDGPEDGAEDGLRDEQCRHQYHKRNEQYEDPGEEKEYEDEEDRHDEGVKTSYFRLFSFGERKEEEEVGWNSGFHLSLDMNDNLISD